MAWERGFLGVGGAGAIVVEACKVFRVTETDLSESFLQSMKSDASSLGVSSVCRWCTWLCDCDSRRCCRYSDMVRPSGFCTMLGTGCEEAMAGSAGGAASVTAQQRAVPNTIRTLGNSMACNTEMGN